MIPFRQHGREDIMPELTPLLDVVFILLIFFVIAAAFAVHGMDMDLPQVSTSRTYAGRALEITLTPDGDLLLDDEPVSLRNLGFIIRDNSKGFGGKPPKQVLFKASPKASVGRFMRTVDTIRENGGQRLVIATDTPRPEAGTK